MKLLIRFTGLIFLFCLFGCATGNRSLKREFYVQPEDFSRIEISLNNKPGIGFINLGYKDYKYKKDYLCLIVLKIELNPDNTLENGLPNDSESEIALSVLNEIEKTTPIFLAGHYVGYFFYDHFLYAYIYHKYPEIAWRFSAKIKREQGFSRKVDFDTKTDTDWNSVNQFGL